MAEDDIKTEQDKSEAGEQIEVQTAAEDQEVDPAKLVEESDASSQEISLAVLQSELVNAQDELAKAQEQVLRIHADSQNVKRRAQQDVEKAHKFGLEKFAESLLPVVDSLERGLESADVAEGSHDAMKEGMELTLKLFLDTLKKVGVERVNPVGEPFDPQLHQAMSQVESADQEPGSVLNVFQKGYTLNGRLIRPAMVVVAKAPAAV